jgi:N-terminal region of glycosyl transferase group 7
MLGTNQRNCTVDLISVFCTNILFYDVDWQSTWCITAFTAILRMAVYLFSVLNILTFVQIGNDVFNRGSLINIGFIEASNRGKFDCYFLHDVDQLPLDDRDFYTCSTSPRHVAVYQKHRNYKLVIHHSINLLVTPRQTENKRTWMDHGP